MKYNKFNKNFENFQKKFDEFENKHYIEIQDYKEFKKENFAGVERFIHIFKKVLTALCVLVIGISIVIIGAGLAVYLSFTVFSRH